MPNKERGAQFLFLAALLWSLSGVFTKSVAWNGLCLATLRGVIAFAISLCLLRGRRIHWSRTKVMAAFCYFAQGILFMCANKLTTAANATVLQNLSPLFIILFNAVLAKKAPTRRECTVCCCLFLGIVLAFAGSMDEGNVVGNCLALTAALFYAGVFFLSKQEDADPLESLALGNGFYLCLLPAFVLNDAVRQTTPGQWAFLVAVASLSGICAWMCFAKGIRTVSALRANFITMTEPVMAPLWTFLFLGEQVGPLSLVGCTVVIVTLIAYNACAPKKVDESPRQLQDDSGGDGLVTGENIVPPS